MFVCKKYNDLRKRKHDSEEGKGFMQYQGRDIKGRDSSDMSGRILLSFIVFPEQSRVQVY